MKIEPIENVCRPLSAPEFEMFRKVNEDNAAVTEKMDRWIRQSQRLETLNSELTMQLDDAKSTLAIAEKLIAKQALRIAELEAAQPTVAGNTDPRFYA